MPSDKVDIKDAANVTVSTLTKTLTTLNGVANTSDVARVILGLLIGNDFRDLSDTYPLPVRAIPGGTPLRIRSGAGTNATLVKNAAGEMIELFLFNNSAADKYVKWYNSASAPTAGAGTPLFTTAIPSGSGIELPPGVRPFSTGIGFTITGGEADGDTTAVAAGDVSGFLIYR